jgi:hypothetical protein
MVSRTLVTGDQRVRLLAMPIRAQGQHLVAVVGQSLEDREQAVADLTNVLLLGGPVALLLASLGGYVLTGRALRPVEVMRRRERAFIADASHELRSPLTMLRTELELMARDQPSGADLDAATSSAIEETERLSRLADDLLLLSRADHQRLALRRVTGSLAQLVEAGADRARRRASARGVRIGVTHDAELPLVPADPDRIGQALDNMLHNGLRYAASEVELTTRVAGSNVEIHVLDDGPGFPPGFLPQAWDRFSQADAARTDEGAGSGSRSSARSPDCTAAAPERRTAQAAEPTSGSACRSPPTTRGSPAARLGRWPVRSQSALLLSPGQDGTRVSDDSPVGQFERRHLRVSGFSAQLLPRTLPQERDRMARRGDHLLVFDPSSTERLLDPPTRMHPRAAVIAVADIERRVLGHPGPPVRIQGCWSLLLSSRMQIRSTRPVKVRGSCPVLAAICWSR